MAQLQGYNAKLSKSGLIGAENIPMKNGSHCHLLQRSLLHFSPAFQFCILTYSKGKLS